jgi:hypothetical protein
MSPDGKVRVLVRSRNVPTRTITFSRPIISLSGLPMGTQTSRAVVFETSFDEHNRKAIREAKKLSCNLDLALEIIDRSKLNPLRRIISAFAGPQSHSPSLVITP